MRQQVLKFAVVVILIMVWAPVSAAFGQTAGAASQAVPPAVESADPAGEGTPEAQEEEAPKFRLDPYGYIKLDASVDTAPISTGNFARWAEFWGTEGDKRHFSITARQTRLGLRIHGPEEKSFQVMGRVEIDFYGGGGENKNGVLLRQAYIQVDWAEKGLTLLAGQTSDIISPLVPRTVNYTVAWWAGNIGYRRPLVGVTKRFGTAGGSTVTLTGGISRTVGDDFGTHDTGENAGIPAVQGRGAFGWSMAGKRAEIGVSGHWGREDFSRFEAEPLVLESWSANIDFLFPLSSIIAIKGEAFQGANLDDYLGGIGQGVSRGYLDHHPEYFEIESKGGWIAVDIDPTEKIQAGFGFSIDDPLDSQLTRGGSRSRNQAIWGNLFYNFTSYLKTAGEVSYWKTDYVYPEDPEEIEPSKAWRYQGTLIFTF